MHLNYYLNFWDIQHDLYKVIRLSPRLKYINDTVAELLEPTELFDLYTDNVLLKL